MTQTPRVPALAIDKRIQRLKLTYCSPATSLASFAVIADSLVLSVRWPN